MRAPRFGGAPFYFIRSPDKVNATMGKVNAPRLAEVH